MKKVFLVCSGLGNVQRGYESFTQECFDALRQETSLELFLFKGAGKSQIRVFTLPNIPRDSWLAGKFSKLFKQDTYFIEQFTFFLSLIPHIYQKRPDVIFFSDFNLGTILWHFRQLTGLSYKLLFSNGAPNGPPFSRMDHVQHLTPIHYQTALDAGESEDKHSLVPYGFKIGKDYINLTQSERENIRSKLNLPTNRPLILSVAAINKTHKRMDYLIQEVARIPEPRPYLLLLGQIDQESPEVIQLGNQMLGSEGFQVKTVPYNEISHYYRSADLFVLASLNEGLPRVLLEAMGYGLPCLVHDYAVTRFVLKDWGYFANFANCGSLSTLLKESLVQNNDLKSHRHKFIYDYFSWNCLRSNYIDMISLCANETPS